jgi:DNA-binding protein YbaB
LDSVERLRRLQREAESQIRRPEAATGTDASGTVQVRVDDAGRLDAVEIHEDWQRRLGAESIARAVLTAAGDAVARRAMNWAERTPRPPDSGPATAATPPTRSSAGRAESMHELVQMLSRALAELDTLAGQLRTAAGRQVTGCSSSGRVTVTVAGSQVVEVTIDTGWLRSAPGGRQVADEIQSACREAYDAEAANLATAMKQAPHATAVRDLAQNPKELLRRLGLG